MLTGLRRNDVEAAHFRMGSATAGSRPSAALHGRLYVLSVSNQATPDIFSIV